MAYNLMVRVDDGAATGAGSVVTGSGDAIAEQMIGYTKLGFNAFNLVPAGPDRLEQIERFGAEVLPALRGQLVGV
jgi:alkanesulfonate monooxygenase SsuD/methylene tetrahydromethanopterin reductase-like flavin-dependent oxidoreductase (luciferase family)